MVQKSQRAMVETCAPNEQHVSSLKPGYFPVLMKVFVRISLASFVLTVLLIRKMPRRDKMTISSILPLFIHTFLSHPPSSFQAQTMGMMTEYYHYIFTTLVMYHAC